LGDREVWGRIAILSGLAGLAITQPTLDLLGRNPEFFVAGHYSTSQIVWLAVLIATVPSLLLALAVLAPAAIDRGAGVVVSTALGAALGALFASVLARGLDVDTSLVVALIAIAGAVLTLLLVRRRVGRMFLQYLALGNVLFLVSFLVLSPTSRLLSNDDAAVDGVAVPELPGPVVVLILDEFPLTTLLRDDGTINAERYPHFAELAERTTWFRNASSHQSLTNLAVPTLLTGRISTSEQLPSWQDHPHNLVSMLAGSVPVHRHELVTDLCPPDLCTPPPAQPLSQAVEDVAVVYGHRALPPALRDDLPAIDHAWGGFGDELGGGAEPTDEPANAERGDDPFARWKGLGLEAKSAPAQAADLVERANAVDAEPALHLIHVALPHYPWILTPWGTRLMEFPKRVEDPADPAYQWSSRLQYQLHSLQVGAADAAIGEVIGHLDDAGIWDDTTLVVVSDHGTGLLPPDFGRKRTDSNQQELFRVPFFIHAPGQRAGEVVDEPAQSIDLLPSLVDLLDISADWEFEGHSLFDGSDATVEPRVGVAFEPALEVVRRHHEDTPHGWDWNAIAAVGEHGDLVGRPLSEVTVGDASRWSWSPDHAADFAALPTAEGKTPQLLTGVVSGGGEGRPPELVVAVNGTIGGALGGYQPDGGAWRFASVLGPYLVDGANDIRAYEVEERGGGIVLHELG
jgi:hypothetical protein